MSKKTAKKNSISKKLKTINNSISIDQSFNNDKNNDTNNDTKIQELIEYVIKILQNKNCFNITVINVLDYLTDYFVIASVDNKITLHAISKYFDNEFLIELKNQSLKKLLENIKIKHDGTYESGWIVIDLYYIWIHLFLPDIRDKYSLERLWTLRNTLKNLSNDNDNDNLNNNLNYNLNYNSNRDLEDNEN